MPIVNYSGQNTHKLTTRMEVGGNKRPVSFLFVPGVNEVPADMWQALFDDPSGAAERMVDDHELTPVVVRPERKGGSRSGGRAKTLETLDEIDVGKMDVHSAEKMVRGTVEMERLGAFDAQEKSRRGGPRRSVTEALEQQMRAVEEADKLAKDRGTKPAVGVKVGDDATQKEFRQPEDGDEGTMAPGEAENAAANEAQARGETGEEFLD